ncbi:MAG: S9 family peptidase [Gemmatimonadetes bacterium]|nr:S9 family peptidase [Gemmatimonadota bacterium]
MSDDHPSYLKPSQAIIDLVDAPPTPSLSLDPKRTCLVMMHRPSLPPIEEVGKEEVRLAGLRIDPDTNGPSRTSYYTGFTIRDLHDQTDRDVTGIPDSARLGTVRFSPSGKRFAFTVRQGAGSIPYVADLETATARPVIDRELNGVFANALLWMPDSESLLCRFVVEDRGPKPSASDSVPVPIIQENLEGVAPSRTYQDLLAGPEDELAFDYFGTSQTTIVGVDGSVREVGAPGVHLRSAPSPDGRYILVETLHRPYSYLVPYYRFPERIAIYDTSGALVKDVADLSLAESVPIAFDAVPEGPRHFEWRADVDAELTWVEALDGGDPAQEVDVRDRAFALKAPFEGEPRVLADFELRQLGIWWGRGDLALSRERWWKNRRLRIWRHRPDETSDPELVIDRSFEDRYGDPGTPLQEWTEQGTRVLMTDGNSLYMVGDGASPEGDKPFLDVYDLKTGESERLSESEPPVFERAIQVIDHEGPTILISRERVDEPTNFYLRNIASDSVQTVTDYPHPYPQLRDGGKELIKYDRDDGVQLTATLHTPPGYDPEKDGPIPTVLWAYPREFKSADAAGQVKDSPHRFVRLSTHSPLYLLAEGYAVLDGPTMPIIGEGDEEANDTYVEQLLASAKAAVDEVVRRGIGEQGRIGVGGHSYGAFMTANLLAHTDLFAAGVARSGAYNRTLTPFGFQAEERTIWQAPDVYAAMSPFMHADRIKTPLLLMHGEADNNSGTFPMQSERFYSALKGHGATTRLVMLPHESHGYRARETILHMLYEMTEWFGTYLKGNHGTHG